MTFFHTVEGWLVLSTIKDLCTKEIIAWDFDTGATVQLAIKTLDKAAYCKDAILCQKALKNSTDKALEVSTGGI